MSSEQDIRDQLIHPGSLVQIQFHAAFMKTFKKHRSISDSILCQMTRVVTNPDGNWKYQKPVKRGYYAWYHLDFDRDGMTLQWNYDREEKTIEFRHVGPHRKT